MSNAFSRIFPGKYNNDDDGGSTFNIDRATDYITESAEENYTGHCAQHVREALQVGGGMDMTGHPENAKDYGLFLESKGFKSLPELFINFPKKGDIVVIQPTSSDNPAGHIAMYNGSDWVSDTIQKNFSAGKKGPFTLYSPRITSTPLQYHLIYLTTRTSKYINCYDSRGILSAQDNFCSNQQISYEIFWISQYTGDSEIHHGDKIIIMTRSWYPINCYNSRGEIRAHDNLCLNPEISDEIFTIYKLNGNNGEIISNEDKIYFQTRYGYYFNCYDSRGKLSAQSNFCLEPSISDELFTIHFFR